MKLQIAIETVRRFTQALNVRARLFMIRSIRKSPLVEKRGVSLGYLGASADLVPLNRYVDEPLIIISGAWASAVTAGALCAVRGRNQPGAPSARGSFPTEGLPGKAGSGSKIDA